MSAHNLLHPLVMDDIHAPRMAQLDLPGVSFVPWNPNTLARSSDPITSKAAASTTKQLAADHQARILAALTQGPAGADLIASRARLLPHAVGKRLAELERAGLIRLTGETVLSNSGRSQREWCRT